MATRNELLHRLISTNGGYHLRSKKEKSRLLDEYCRLTGQNRNYVIRKIRSGTYVRSMRKETGREKRTRTPRYDREIVFYLIKLWEIFDHPSGARMVVQIREELARLRRFGELTVTDEIAEKLLSISSAQIDRRLSPHKEKECLKQKYEKKIHPLLYQKIPIRTSFQQDRSSLGNIQIDLVEHCGQSGDGPYCLTLSTTDLASHWWAGGAVLTKGMRGVTRMLDQLRREYPFPWGHVHSDNDSAFLNAHLYRYTVTEHLRFSRSRPYEKNDNFLVEQKNGRVVRRTVGYRRYDTGKEQRILNELYRVVGLYVNFFQPVMKLVAKERIGTKLTRRFDAPMTPYCRVLADPSVSQQTKGQLIERYADLNPAQLKREITAKQEALYNAYRAKDHQRITLPVSLPWKELSLTFVNDLTQTVSLT